MINRIARRTAIAAKRGTMPRRVRIATTRAIDTNAARAAAGLPGWGTMPNPHYDHAPMVARP